MTRDPGAEGAVNDHDAARLLGVEPDQLDAMIEQGLLTPLSTPGERTFDAAEVHAVRALGG